MRKDKIVRTEWFRKLREIRKTLLVADNLILWLPENVLNPTEAIRELDSIVHELRQGTVVDVEEWTCPDCCIQPCACHYTSQREEG